MIDWTLIAQHTDESPAIVSLQLKSKTAKQPICLRLLGATQHDTVSVSLSHLKHTPFVFPIKVDTFQDIWLDPYEFDCRLYGIDALPSPLQCNLEWRVQGPASVWTPSETSAHYDWHLSAQILQVEEKPAPEPPKTSLQDLISTTAQTQQIPEGKAALLALIINMFAMVQLNPERLLEPQVAAPVATGLTHKEPAPGPADSPLQTGDMFRRLGAHAILYWPAFKDSTLTSWSSTVINSFIRDLNDRDDLGIPEDFDLPELLATWCPAQPWTPSPKPLCESIGALESFLQTLFERECSDPGWRNSLVVAAIAMAQPHLCLCIPNERGFRAQHTWDFGTVARNYLYGFIYAKIGTEPDKWFERLGINKAQMGVLVRLCTHVLFSLKDQNIEPLLKKMILGIIRHIESSHL